VAAYYLMVGAAVMVLYRIDPNLPGLFEPGVIPDGLDPAAAAPRTSGRAALDAFVAMLAAFVLSLPVAWIYLLTRRKRGYRQSLIQTAIILPIVVAGVVILVKSSIALAFSLGGIVGAIGALRRAGLARSASARPGGDRAGAGIRPAPPRQLSGRAGQSDRADRAGNLHAPPRGSRASRSASR
jgi:hypothetical protein